jgi:hypothetical protein
MTRNVTEIQKFLLSRDLDIGPYGADGRLGFDTLNAINRYLASQGKPPFRGIPSLTEINAAMFPEEQPAPKPRSNPLAQLAIKAMLSSLKGRLPMLSGYKTYATAAVIAIMALYSLIFGDLPLVGHLDPAQAIMALLSSLGLSFARIGAKTEAKKATGQL